MSKYTYKVNGNLFNSAILAKQGILELKKKGEKVKTVSVNNEPCEPFSNIMRITDTAVTKAKAASPKNDAKRLRLL